MKKGKAKSQPSQPLFIVNSAGAWGEEMIAELKKRMKVKTAKTGKKEEAA